MNIYERETKAADDLIAELDQILENQNRQIAVWQSKVQAFADRLDALGMPQHEQVAIATKMLLAMNGVEKKIK